MIPKKIHYCWFGGGEMSERDKKCIDSWKRFCPDYEIIRWDESNYDVTKNLYMHQAYINKKWGFVPDYARLDIVYNHGGIYLDTDVEIIRNFDPLLDCDMYCGFENEYAINFGQGFGAVMENEIIKKLRDDYDSLVFAEQDGSLNLTPSPQINTKVLQSCGVLVNNTMQKLGGLIVYPVEYFCPMKYSTGQINITEKTYSIHHFHASWLQAHDKLQRRVSLWCYKNLGVFLGKHVSFAVNFLIRVVNKFYTLGIYETCKFAIDKLRNR